MGRFAFLQLCVGGGEWRRADAEMRRRGETRQSDEVGGERERERARVGGDSEVDSFSSFCSTISIIWIGDRHEVKY